MTSALPTGVFTNAPSDTTATAAAVLAANANGTVKVLFTATNSCGSYDTTSLTVPVRSLSVDSIASSLVGTYTQGGLIDSSVNYITVAVVNKSTSGILFTPAANDIALAGATLGMAVAPVSTTPVNIPNGGTITNITYKITGTPSNAGPFTATFRRGLTTFVKSGTVNVCATVSNVVVSNTFTPATLPDFIDAGNKINFTTTGGTSSFPVKFSWTMTSALPTGVFTNAPSDTTATAAAVLAANANGTVKVLFTATNSCGSYDTTSKTITVNSLAVNCGTSLINGIYTQGGALNSTNTVKIVVTNNSTIPITFTPAVGDIVLSNTTITGMSVLSVSAGSLIPVNGSMDAIYTLTGTPNTTGTFTVTFTRGLTTCTTPAKTVVACAPVSDIVVSNTTTPATLPAFIDAGNKINFTTTGGTSSFPVKFSWTMTSALPTGVFTNAPSDTTATAAAVLAANANGTVKVLFTATNSCGSYDTTSKTITVNSLAVNCPSSLIYGNYTLGVALDSNNNYATFVVGNNSTIPLSFTPTPGNISLTGAVAGIIVNSAVTNLVTIPVNGSSTVTYKLIGTPSTYGTFRAIFTSGFCQTPVAKTVNPCPPVSDIVVSNTTTPATLPAFIDAGNKINFTTTGGTSPATPVKFAWTMTSSPAGLFTNASSDTTAAATAVLAANANGTVTVLFTATNNCGVYDTTSKTITVNSMAVNCVPSTINGVYTKDVAMDGTNTISIVVANNGSTPLTFTPAPGDIALSGITGTMAVSTVSAPTATPAGGTSTITYNLTGTPTISGPLTVTWKGGSLSCVKTVTVSNCPTISDVVVNNTFTPATLPVFIDASSRINFTTTGGSSPTANPVKFSWTMTSSTPGLFTNASSDTTASATAVLAANANGAVTVVFTAINNCGVKDTTSRTVTINSLTVACASSVINGTYTQGVPLDPNNNYITYVVTNNSTVPLSFTPTTSDISFSVNLGITVNSAVTTLVTIPAGGTSTLTYSLTGTPSGSGSFTATFTKGLTICTTPLAKTVNPCPPVTDIVVSNTTTPAPLLSFISASNSINFTTTGGTSTASMSTFTWAMTSTPTTGVFTNTNNSTGYATSATANLAANANGTITVLFRATNSCGSFDTTSSITTVRSLTVDCNASTLYGTYTVNTALNSGNYVTMSIKNSSNIGLSFNPASSDITLGGSLAGLTVTPSSTALVTVPANSSINVSYNFTGTPTTGGAFTVSSTKDLTCQKNGNVTCPATSAITVTNGAIPASPIYAGNTISFSASGGTPDNGSGLSWTMTSSSGNAFSNPPNGTTANATATLKANAVGTITITFSSTNACGIVTSKSATVAFGDNLRLALFAGGCASCASYDAQGVNSMVQITQAEYNQIDNYTTSYTAGASESFMNMPFTGTPYTTAPIFDNNPFAVQGNGIGALAANSYITGFSFVSTANGSTTLGIKLGSSVNSGYGNPIFNITVPASSTAGPERIFYIRKAPPNILVPSTYSFVGLYSQGVYNGAVLQNQNASGSFYGPGAGQYTADLPSSSTLLPLYQMKGTPIKNW